MLHAANGDNLFQVYCSEAVGDSIRLLQRKAERRGQGKAFLVSFRKIITALQNNPNKVGEPLYRLSGLRLRVRSVVVAPLVIHFGVNEDHPIVFIKSATLLSARRH
jgi:hypothetical protein